MKIIPSGMLLFASLLTALCSCEKNDSFAGDIPSFPVGRSFLNTSSVDIKINGAA